MREMREEKKEKLIGREMREKNKKEREKGKNERIMKDIQNEDVGQARRPKQHPPPQQSLLSTRMTLVQETLASLLRHEVSAD